MRQRRTNKRSAFFPVIALFVLSAGHGGAGSLAADLLTATEPGNKIFEEWSVLTVDGKRCGYEGTVVSQAGPSSSPQYCTLHQEQFVVKRMGSDLKLTETSRITEDAEGGVLSFDDRTFGGGSDISITGHREDDELVVSSRGETRRYKVPRLAALGPEKVRRLSDALPLQPGRTFSFPTFESDYPQAPVLDSGTVVRREMRQVAGVERQLWRVKTDTSLLPGLPGTAWVDDQGNDVEAILDIPGIGHLDEIVSTRADCMKQPEGAEIFATSLLHPQRVIPSPRDQAEAIYRITSDDKTHPLPFWNGGEQRVLSSKPGEIVIAVTAPDTTPSDASYSLPHPDTPGLHEYLAPSAYLESNSPEIRKLAREAVGDETNPVRAAARIERFVRAYIVKKDLNIGFASAEETAQLREGDCTEHAVLCAAIGRAAGMPTRCVVGFGYIPPGVDEPTISNAVDRDTGIFGFHMWAEAMIAPRRWVAMDAALDGFDVSHIAIIKTALEEIDPLVDLNMPILQLMQNLKIDVVKTVPKTPAPLSGPPGVD
jgi:transglutaminase-like putative cysteine protease